MPYILVAYDISDDYKRDLAARMLISMGFERIQRSVYVARGGAEKARQAAAALRRVINPATDKVHILVLPEQSWRLRIEIGYGEPPGGFRGRRGVQLV